MKKSRSLAHYLGCREMGPKCGKGAPLMTDHCVQELLEEKATLPNKNLPCELSGQTRSTLLVAFSPDGTRLASTHCDHTVRITEIRTGKCTHILTGHPRTPWSIAYHPSSNDILATGCLAGEVRIWDLRGGGSEVWCTDENVSITSLAFHPVDQVLVIALANELLFWDWTQQSEPFTKCRTAHNYEKVRWVKFDPCGHKLYTGIANSATIHADEEDIGYIGDEGAFSGAAASRERQPFMQERYHALVEEITQRQRDRISFHLQVPVVPNASASRFYNALASSRPLSPHHLSSLNDARSYAHRTSVSVANARAYAASVTNSSSRQPDSLHSLLSDVHSTTAQRPAQPAPLLIPLEPVPSVPTQQDPRIQSESEPTRPSASTSGSNRGFLFDSLLRSQLTVPGSSSSRAVTSAEPSSTYNSSRSLSFRENSAIGAVTVVAGSSPRAAPTQSSRATAFFSVGQSGAMRPQSGLLSSAPSATVNTSNTLSTISSTGFAQSTESNHSATCPNHCPVCSIQSIEARPYSARLRDMLVLPSRVSRSTSGSPLPRRQPHRLASIIENDVRQTLDQVRARRIDISETLRDLDQLRQELASTSSASAPPAGEDASPRREETGEAFATDTDDVDSMIAEAGSRGSVSSPVSVLASDSSRSSVAGDPPSDSEMDAVSVDSTDSGQEGFQRPLEAEHDGSSTLRTFGAYSAELESRVNELDQRVSEIQRRLNDRMRALSQERQRYTGPVPSSSAPPSSTGPSHWSGRLQSHQASSQRRRERFARMRARLDEMRTRLYYSRPEATSASDQPRESDPRDFELSSRRERMLRLRAVHQDIQNMRQEIARRRQQVRDSERAWHRLQRRSLHPHYSSSILDDTVNNEGEGLQAAVNRVIAGAYLTSAPEISMSSVGNQTHRIQQWDFSKCLIPDISNSESNVVVAHCKIHNDANCDISQDGHLLATFVPSQRGFPDDTLLAVYSLLPETLGQCLYTKSFAPNAVSLSLSPLNNYVLIGLASRRMTCPLNPKQMVAQVYKLVKPKAGEDSTDHICDIMHPCDSDIRAPVSINSARWLPGVGEGLVYGTNRGDLHVYRPGFDQEEKRSSSGAAGSGSGLNPEPSSLRRDLMQMLGLTVPRTTSTSTQTVHRVRRTASTQTDSTHQDDMDSEPPAML